LAPQIVLISDVRELHIRVEKKPLGLFLKAHFLDLRLVRVQFVAQYGRVIQLHFTGGASLEIRLFPAGQNIIAHANNRSIAWAKPHELKPQSELGLKSDDGVPLRSWEDLSREWLLARQGATGRTDARLPDPQQELKLRRQKLQKAIDKIVLDIERRRQEPWAQVGQWIGENQSLRVPTDWVKYVDSDKSLGWNLENCFQKAKENKLKLAGAEKRRAELLVQLENSTLGNSVTKGAPQEKSLLKAAQSKGRTYDLGEGLILYIGKSAQDNLRLLREARPWNLWLHLRDEPSAHAILHRNKNQKVSDALLQLAAHHLVRHTYGDKHQRYQGQKMPVILAECRFVRPIKGDRVGRVTYSDERSFLHQYNPVEKT
jgi:predicted ribosome quality control (RQC) complex YloA/Tae2 family protein